VKFTSAILNKYKVIARETKKKVSTKKWNPSKMKKDIKDFMDLERKEFLLDEHHLSLEDRKQMAALRKKELEKKKTEIVKDINEDPNLTKAQKKSDITRLETHLEHYGRGLDSMVNAMKWRDAEDIPDEEWAKKILEPKGGKLGYDKIPSFAIPPGLTCPKASTCKNHCFAMSGHTEYVQMVRDTHSAALGLSERDDFVEKVNTLIQKKWKNAKKPDPKKPYRIHAWGDFYSNAYAKKWVQIIKDNPNVFFYAYTKSFTMPAIKMLMDDIKKKKVKNAKIIQSLNGKSDKDIDPKAPIAVVFKSRSDMDDWNAGATSMTATKYEKQKIKKLQELEAEIESLSKKEDNESKNRLPYAKKELRKLKREIPHEREAAFNNLVNLLTKLKITPKNGKFVECHESDLVAADPKNKRIGIVEHGELHQPRGYKIQEVEQTITASVLPAFFDNHACERFQSIAHNHE